MKTYTVRGTYEIQWEMHVLADSALEAEELVMNSTDNDILENQTDATMYIGVVSL